MSAVFLKSVILAVGICLASGCGESHPPTYPVSGQVVFPDGTTLKNGGQVLFRSDDGTAAIKSMGYFGADGRFELTTFTKGDGATAGNYEVAVLPSIPDDTDDLTAQEARTAMEPIDPRFKNQRSSGLKFTVSAETSPHDFRIEVTRPRRRRRSR